jgi:hypothetical protein
MAVPKIPTNAALNAAVHARLLEMRAPTGMCHPPTHPWATNLLASVTLLEDDVLCCALPIEVTLTIAKRRPEAMWSDLVYTCRLEGRSGDGSLWWSEATADALPRAICLAYIQVQEEEPTP